MFFRFDAKNVFFRLFSRLKRTENEMRQKNEKEAKTSKAKKENYGTICNQMKKNIKVGLLVSKSIPSEVKRSEKTFIWSETKKS